MAKCGTCIYRTKISKKHSCAYLIITGNTRGCPVENCDKYRKGKSKLRSEYTKPFRKGC